MKKVLLRKMINSLIFIFFAFVMEIISFLFMFQKGFANYFYLDLLFFLILTFPVFLIKSKKMDHIYFSILLILLSMLWIVNTNFYRVFGDIFSLQYLFMVGEGLSIVSTSYIHFFHLLIMLLLDLFFVLLMVFKDRKEVYPLQVQYQKKGLLVSTLLLIVSLSCYLLTLQQVCQYEKNVKNNPTIDLITLAKTANFQKLGMLSYYGMEANSLFSHREIKDEEIDALRHYFLLYDKDDNAYTGLLKDYSVVTIMIETGAMMMVNETLTPNLYHWLQKGVHCANNYSKNKTNVSEYIGIAGNYPTAGFNLSKYNYEIPFSIPNLLNEQYATMFFHDVGGSKDIYRRELLMPQLGFENTYLHDDLWPDVPMWTWNGDYPLDSWTIDSVLNYIYEVKDQPFYAYWTTLSMHGPYFESANERKLKNEYYETLKAAEKEGKWINPLVSETNGNRECIEIYMMAVMDFDVALGKMITAFENEGLMDQTLFVLYGDHELYYNGADDNPLNLVLTPHENLSYYDIYDTVLLFYNETLNEKFYNEHQTNKITSFTSPNVIVPTILDLLGVDYNPNYYMGTSVFSEEFLTPQVFYSYELSNFFNDQFWSNDGLSITKVFDPQGDEEQFLNTVSGMITKQIHLDAIYKRNFFAEYDENFIKK